MFVKDDDLDAHPTERVIKSRAVNGPVSGESLKC